VLVRRADADRDHPAPASGVNAYAASSPAATRWAAGAMVAAACNLINNLPSGLIVHSVASSASAPSSVTDALLIGVDLGPNLSITGSLATILWLVALRREGKDISAWQFLRVGILVTVARSSPSTRRFKLGSTGWPMSLPREPAQRISDRFPSMRSTFCSRMSAAPWVPF